MRRIGYYLYVELMNLLEEALNPIIVTRVMEEHKSCMYGDQVKEKLIKHQHYIQNH